MKTDQSWETCPHSTILFPEAQRKPGGTAGAFAPNSLQPLQGVGRVSGRKQWVPVQEDFRSD